MFLSNFQKEKNNDKFKNTVCLYNSFRKCKLHAYALVLVIQKVYPCRENKLYCLVLYAKVIRI